MPRTADLSASSTVVLDGSGNGTAEVGPSAPGEVWLPESTGITCTGAIPTTGTPTLFIYAGNGISPATFIDSTYNVTSAASSLISGKKLYPGQQVFAVWSGGPPGQTATLAVKGTRQVP
jgi:hypothetical protein